MLPRIRPTSTLSVRTNGSAWVPPVKISLASPPLGCWLTVSDSSLILDSSVYCNPTLANANEFSASPHRRRILASSEGFKWSDIWCYACELAVMVPCSYIKATKSAPVKSLNHRRQAPRSYQSMGCPLDKSCKDFGEELWPLLPPIVTTVMSDRRGLPNWFPSGFIKLLLSSCHIPWLTKPGYLKACQSAPHGNWAHDIPIGGKRHQNNNNQKE